MILHNQHEKDYIEVLVLLFQFRFLSDRLAAVLPVFGMRHSPAMPARQMAAAVSFTGGKDSVLALHLVSAGSRRVGLLPHLTPPAVPPVTLLVTFSPPSRDFKAHPLPIIQALAALLGIPHVCLDVHGPDYLDSYRQQLRRLHTEHSITHLVTGDILDVCAGFMDRAVQGSSVQLVRPLWQWARTDVLAALQHLQIRSKISCIDLCKFESNSTRPKGHAELQQQNEQCTEHNSSVSCGVGADRSATCDASRKLLGRELTAELVCGPLSAAAQRFGVDLCGEHGEYHTLVWDAPLMRAPLRLVAAEHKVVESDGYRHAYVVWEPLL
jgi:diphthamide synthase (EF-2-diphthine--ammonia ligase)